MGTSKKITTIFVYVMALFGIGVGTYLVSQNQNIGERAAPTPALYINPSTLSINPNQTFSLDVMVDSPSKHINGVDIKLTFDPSGFEVINIEEGSKTSKLDNVVTEQTTIDNLTGKLSFVAFTTDKTQAIRGAKIKIFSVHLKSKGSSGVYDFNLDPQSIVTAIDEPSNIISLYSGSKITVRGTSSPKPAATQTPAASPVPSTISTPAKWKRPDLNRDGFINIIDIGILLDNYNLPITNIYYDINSDDVINIIDIGIVIDNYGL